MIGDVRKENSIMWNCANCRNDNWETDTTCHICHTKRGSKTSKSKSEKTKSKPKRKKNLRIFYDDDGRAYQYIRGHRVYLGDAPENEEQAYADYEDFGGHTFSDGKCIECGVTESTARYFGWKCKHKSKSKKTEDNSRSHAQNNGSQPSEEVRFGRILGLRGKVTKDDVKKRWRELCTQYHPDKVAHLGPKLRVVAEEEMKAINEAFDYFRDKYQIK